MSGNQTSADQQTRSEFLAKGALAVGSAYGALAVGPYVRRALARSGSGDIDILNFALTLEYLEAKFYSEAKRRAKASGELKSLISLLAKDEQQHVDALKGTIKKLGGKPVAEPNFDFPYSGVGGFLKLAQTLEDTGVSAYNGAAPMIKSKEVLTAAGSIVQVEARHAAAIRLQNEAEPAPAGFDKPLGEKQVLKAVGPFLA